MYLEALIKLGDYLSTLVVRKNSLLVQGGDLQYEPSPRYFDPITGDPIVEKSGLLFTVRRDGTKELYDNGALFDPYVERVPGDHYATSHFLLMNAILSIITGKELFYERVKNSVDFCLKTLGGYPRVVWGNHYDFNNYAIALSLYILWVKLTASERQRWIRSLLRAKMNRHKVNNWRGQRVLFLRILSASGVKWTLKHYVKYFMDLFYFKRSQDKDGAFEDKKNKSRPIQYHAFSLCLAILIDYFQNIKRSLFPSIIDGVKYLISFVGPDGDFNYFGRGQRQIFAYSPALFVLEVFSDIYPPAKSAAKNVWEFVQRYQKPDGSFPLVLSPFPEEKKVGWYDYHRFTVYNSFFGAWLALAEYEHREKLFGRHLKKYKIPSKKVQNAKIFIARTKSYFICLSRGFPQYSSECALSPHKLYIDDLGTVMSCPGGPARGEKGFGNKNIFKFEPINFFAPIYRDRFGKWYNPGKVKSDMFLKDGRIKYRIRYGVLIVMREFEFSENGFSIKDDIQLEDLGIISELRIINMPVIGTNETVSIEGNSITMSNRQNNRKLKIDISTEVGLKLYETFEWVEGQVMVIGVSENPISNHYALSYIFKITG